MSYKLINMLHKNPIHNIVNWTDETVEKIFTTFIDGYEDRERAWLKSKHATIEQKRTFLINKEKNHQIIFK